MSRLARTGVALICAASLLPTSAFAQAITALPDQVSTIRLSNRDVNHIVCVGGEIEDVKFSAEKAIAVERAGSDAWVKFLVKEIDDMGRVNVSRKKALAEAEKLRQSDEYDDILALESDRDRHIDTLPAAAPRRPDGAGPERSGDRDRHGRLRQTYA